MAFIIGIDRRRRQAAFGPRIRDILEVGLLIPRTPNVLVLGQIEHQLDRLVRRDVSEERIVQLAHRVERLWCMDTLTPSREVIVLEVR